MAENLKDMKEFRVKSLPPPLYPIYPFTIPRGNQYVKFLYIFPDYFIYIQLNPPFPQYVVDNLLL